MIEIDINTTVRRKQKIEVSEQKEEIYEMEHDHTIVPHANHILFEIDIESEIVFPSKYLKLDYVYNPNWSKKAVISTHGKVIMREGKVYVSAMNSDNALKKFKKGLNGSKLDSSKTYLEL
jgi:hypothetical protein